LAKEDKFQFQCWVLGLIGAGVTQGKKGADRGIDGRMFFHDDAEYAATKQIVFSVKGGENVGVGAVRDLRGVLDREKAQIGVLISLHSPTKPMMEEAVSAGCYESPDKRKYPRIQLLTISELLGGKKLDMPPWAENRTFAKAVKCKVPQSSNKTLPFDEKRGV